MQLHNEDEIQKNRRIGDVIQIQELAMLFHK